MAGWAGACGGTPYLLLRLTGRWLKEVEPGRPYQRPSPALGSPSRVLGRPGFGRRAQRAVWSPTACGSAPNLRLVTKPHARSAPGEVSEDARRPTSTRRRC